MFSDHIKYQLKTYLDDPTVTDEVLITKTNEATSLEWERQQKFKKNAHIKETKVTETQAEPRQNQEIKVQAIAGKEPSMHSQVKVLKASQDMNRQNSLTM